MKSSRLKAVATLWFWLLVGVWPLEAVAQSGPDKTSALTEFSEAIRDLTEHVSRSVVQIVSTGYGLMNDENQAGGENRLVRQRASGSGVILSADGLIMTNAHVVDGARHISVQLNGGSERTVSLDATVVGLDRTQDLALLRVDAEGLPPLEFTDSDTLRQGQLVLAFGSPLGLDNSVSMGVISSVARQITSDDPRIYVQTDAPINPGNSGGPLVDVNGRIVGLNTFILSQSGGSEGLGFAVPSNVVAYAFNQLKKDGHVHHGQIGVALRTITEPLAQGLGLRPYEGALIEDIAMNSAAEAAGLNIGDVILSIGTRPVHSARDFALGTYRYSIGDTASLNVLRGDRILAFEVMIMEPDDDPERLADMVDPQKNAIPQLGFLGMELNDSVRKILGDLRSSDGVLVAARSGTSAYLGEELQLGDVIHSVNGHAVTKLDELRSILEKQKPGSPLVLQVERDSRLKYLVLEEN
jgi:serine protease Do